MPSYIIPNLQNACKVLKLLQTKTDGLSITAIAEKLDLPRTSVLRIITTLHEENFLLKEEKRYRLGPSLIPLGTAALDSVDLRKTAQPILRELAKATEETSHLAIESDRNCLLLEVCQSPNPIRIGAPAGTLTDMHCSGTGKIFIAYNHLHELESFLDSLDLKQRTSKTLTTVPQFREESSIIKEQGFAMDDEEYIQGVRCLAAPVKNNKGEIIAAIGITATTSRFTRRKIPMVAVKVIQAADKLSAMLGY